VRMTQFSNFAIRVLMYAGLNGRRPSAVPEMARAYSASRGCHVRSRSPQKRTKANLAVQPLHPHRGAAHGAARRKAERLTCINDLTSAREIFGGDSIARPSYHA
jgi:hypothetical protein